MKERRILFWYDGIMDVILEKKGHGGAEVQLYLLAKELSKNKKNKIFISCRKEEMNEKANGKINEKANEKVKEKTKGKKQAPYENIFLSPIIRKINPIEIGKDRETESTKTRFIKRLADPVIRKISKVKNWILTVMEFIRINPDIVITRTAGRQVNRSATLAKILGRKFIFMAAHDDECNGIYEKKHPENAREFIKGIKKTDLIICQNEYQQKEIEKNYGKKSILMKSMYPLNSFKGMDREYSLWIGRCEKWKRPEAFIRLAKKNPAHKFKMICAATKKEKKYYENICAVAKKMKNLELIEYVPFHSMDEEFRKAKLFINTSTAEGFPNTFIQAMKNKTPLLSLNVDPDGILEKNGIGTSCNDDMKKLDKQFRKMMSNENSLRKMGQKGYRYSRKNHDITKISKEYEKIFDYLCK